MDSNTHSTPPSGTRPPTRRSPRLAALATEIDHLAAEDLVQLTDAALAEQVLELRWLRDRLDGQWLRRLATVDGRGAAGAEDDLEIGSTAAWLRGRLRIGARVASAMVRTARAQFPGPLAGTARAVCAGELSPAYAQVLASGTKDLPEHVAVEAEPVLLELARRLDPTRLRQAVDHLVLVADPDGAEEQRERRHGRRRLWLAPTFEGMVAVDGLLEPAAGQLVLSALEPLARPADAGDPRTGSQRTADALGELARRSLEAGWLPKVGGVRPRLAVVVDLDSLQGRGRLGGEAGWAGPLDPETCRRLACDAAITRVLVSRQPDGHQRPASHHADPTSHGSGQPLHDHPDHEVSADPAPSACCDPGGHGDQGLGLTGWLRQFMTRLPAILGGAPTQPVHLGRSTRVISPGQRTALAVRDGGCMFPDCARPLAWCEGHHLVSWGDPASHAASSRFVPRHSLRAALSTVAEPTPACPTRLRPTRRMRRQALPWPGTVAL